MATITGTPGDDNLTGTTSAASNSGGDGKWRAAATALSPAGTA